MAPMRGKPAGRGPQARNTAGFDPEWTALEIEREPRSLGDPARAVQERRYRFFIRKAIGWVRREVGKKRPDLVHEWLLPRASRASGLTVREAVKYLPEAMEERIMAVRAAPSEGGGNGGQEREAERPDRPSGAE